MTNLLNEEDATVQVRIRMLVLGGVAVLLAGIAIVSIKEGEFGALVITLVFGFVCAEIIQKEVQKHKTDPVPEADMPGLY